MERWSYTSVQHSSNGAEVKTTEPPVVSEILEGLKKIIPSARIRFSDPKFERLGISGVTFDRLDGMDFEVIFWIVARLCELGWEPLGGMVSGRWTAYVDVYQFRRRYGPAEIHSTAD